MMRAFRWAVPAVLLALVLLATGSASAKVGRASGAQTFTVNVDETSPKANVDFLAYFPHSITVHAGDTVVFHWAGDRRAAHGDARHARRQRRARPSTSSRRRSSRRTRRRRRSPRSTRRCRTCSRRGRATRPSRSSNPCYQQSGAGRHRTSARTRSTSSPPSTGRSAYYNSGWLDSGQKWTMHLSGAHLARHVPVHVRAAPRGDAGEDHRRPGEQDDHEPAAQFALGQKQLANDAEAARAGVAAIAAGQAAGARTSRCRAPNAVLAGSGVPNSSGAIDEFGEEHDQDPGGRDRDLVGHRPALDHVQLGQDERRHPR